MNYELLLSLLGGRGSVVEQLLNVDIAALELPTPVLDYIRQRTGSSQPGHLVLSGNAGDGKSFITRRVEADLRGSDWEVLSDASELDVPVLARRLNKALAAKKRLLIAINRGQLERLHYELRSHESLAATFARRAMDGLRLRPRWSASDVEALGDVTTIDLGLQDTLHPTLVDAAIDKALQVQLPGSSPAALSLRAAQAAISDQQVRKRLELVLSAVRCAGHHATMRELWNLIAHLFTGGRTIEDERPLSLRDAVGARLLSSEESVADVPLATLAGRVFDPARHPHPRLTRASLTRRVADELRRLPGLEPLVTNLASMVGERLPRAAWLHGSSLVDPVEPLADARTYQRLVSLSGADEGWVRTGATAPLLQGLYRMTGLPQRSREIMLGWRRLCYDSQRIAETPRVAGAKVKLERLRLALPRPNPQAAQALDGLYRPPFVWLGVEGEEHKILRLDPEMVSVLTANSDQTTPGAARSLVVEQWIERLPTDLLQGQVDVALPDGSYLSFIENLWLSQGIRVEEI